MFWSIISLCKKKVKAYWPYVTLGQIIELNNLYFEGQEYTTFQALF